MEIKALRDNLTISLRLDNDASPQELANCLIDLSIALGYSSTQIKSAYKDAKDEL